METWVLGVILSLVGILLLVVSVGQEEIGFSVTIAGLGSTLIGSIIAIFGFRKWIEHYC